MVKDFYQDKSFIEWQLKPAFNASLLSRHFEIQIMFRTRQHNGMVFSAASFSTLERLQLKVRTPAQLMKLSTTVMSLLISSVCKLQKCENFIIAFVQQNLSKQNLKYIYYKFLEWQCRRQQHKITWTKASWHFWQSTLTFENKHNYLILYHSKHLYVRFRRNCVFGTCRSQRYCKIVSSTS